MIQLLTNQTANGSSGTHTTSCETTVVLVGEGTWDTSTLTLEISPDGGTTWVSTGKTLTADGIQTIDLPAGCKLRATLSSVGAGSDVNAWISG